MAGQLFVCLVTVLVWNLISYEADGVTPAHTSHHLSKRNVAQLCSLIQLYTNRNCLGYMGYGCFCGLGGVGTTPVDDTDNCCLTHDNCYTDAGKLCGWLSPPHLVTYKKSCNGTRCTCEDSQSKHPCRYKTCQCDLEFAQCLTLHTYDNKYAKYDKKKCKEQNIKTKP
ncbi:basic phospholipase A2 pseudexin A chain-like [Physella acuta]|uniref:basic phospholipase A2 pseudexin A chain-like n=1 Tax=Physella acuta TaxID=109671 RepID=UPI0027DB54AC|nr:basic phospholipase A2 pseudexin A chain-like [Physella acuta]